MVDSKLLQFCGLVAAVRVVEGGKREARKERGKRGNRKRGGARL